MRLQGRRRGGHRGRGDDPADAPSGHGVGLGDAVDHHAALGGGGGDHRKRHVLVIVVGEVLVDLVGHHPDAVLGRPVPDRRDLLRGVHAACGVGRGDEYQQLGARRPRRFQLLDRDAVAAVHAGVHDHRSRSGQCHRLGVAGPVRSGQDDLVAGIQQCQQGVVDGVLATRGDDHLLRRDIEAGVPQRLGGNGLAQLRKPRRRGVAVVAVLTAGSDRGLHDVRRRREVGLSGTEADNRLPRCAQRLGFGVGADGGRGRDRRHRRRYR